ncbi:hypothetical protein GCM10027299_11330 [Larkinella ripae]
MKKLLLCLLLGGLAGGGHFSPVFGQASDPLFFGGVHLNMPVGRYKPLTFGAGFDARFQYPVLPKLALTARAGLELFRINYASLNPYAYLGYGYNPISGFGFNTMYMSYASRNERVTALNVPLGVGPRLFLTDRLHADVLAGLDVAASEHMRSSFRLEGGGGYLLPLRQGGFLDINAGFFTSFAKGSNLLTLGVSYGFKLR